MFSVQECRENLTKCVDILFNLPNQHIFAEHIAKYRHMKSADILKSQKCFYIDSINEITENLNYTDSQLHELGLINEPNKFGIGGITSALVNSYNIPIYDIYGKTVIGIMSYDMDRKMKYIRSSTLGFDKSNTALGLEMIPKALEDDYIFIGEGTFDYLHSKAKGINCTCFGGVYLPKYIIQTILSITNVFIVTDSDDAGKQARKYWKYEIPHAKYIEFKDVKDIDEYLRYNDISISDLINHEGNIVL